MATHSSILAWEIQWTGEPAGLQTKGLQRVGHDGAQNTGQEQILDSAGEGKGGMNGENGTEICIISYVKRVASPGSMHDTGCLGLVHWDDPEGWYGEGGGRRVQDGEHL